MLNSLKLDIIARPIKNKLHKRSYKAHFTQEQANNKHFFELFIKIKTTVKLKQLIFFKLRISPLTLMLTAPLHDAY